MRIYKHPALLGVILLGLVSCSKQNKAPSPYHNIDTSNEDENYRAQKDGPPQDTRSYSYNNKPATLANYPELPRSRSGNSKSYTVLGKTYYVLPTNKNFVQCGKASWYGNKFHGRHTASGEIYDMHKFSAAHTTLPIPVFMKVTNLENGKSIVVRVNDRGPFHHDRIIDLSYAAATALGIAGQGLGNVEVRSLDYKGASACHSGAGGEMASPSYTEEQNIVYANDYYIQVGAFLSMENLVKMKNKLKKNSIGPTVVHQFRKFGKIIHRLRIGPLHKQHQVNSLAKQLDNAGFFDYQLVKENNE
jgi:rare lipoprotein A